MYSIEDKCGKMSRMVYCKFMWEKRGFRVGLDLFWGNLNSKRRRMWDCRKGN